MLPALPTARRPAPYRALLALAAALALSMAPLAAQVVDASSLIRAYDIRYQTTTHGSIALIGNTMVTCPDADAA